MNRKEAAELLPIIKAFSEGKVIESRSKRFKEDWKEVTEIHGFAYISYEFRIKPEPKYRPFKDAEECWQEMQNHQPFGWVKWNDVRYNIYVVSSTSVCLINGNCEHMDFAYAYQKLTFADGIPFGVKEEE